MRMCFIVSCKIAKDYRENQMGKMCEYSDIRENKSCNCGQICRKPPVNVGNKGI